MLSKWLTQSNYIQMQIARNLTFSGKIFLYLCFLPYQTWSCDIVAGSGQHRPYMWKNSFHREVPFHTHWSSQKNLLILATSSVNPNIKWREGYSKDLRIKPGVFYVNASLIRYFWITFAIRLYFLIQVLEWLFFWNSIIFPLNNNISPFPCCFTWSIGHI